ncbi:hypothetical protein AOQ84DRAFT_289324 [Glonium stellatum]|uniref:Something about silencing protein 4 domain-containing protein n=1 Tax=Glonium stellatum TaxID=574774 RepID=A0A8E2F4Y3_9PEZI|nr:hypothetical protein AOQ84DRAFT_289324 [Glonium stellatum]
MLRSSSGRFAAGTHPKSPATEEPQNNALTNNKVPTRRSAQNKSLLALTDEKPARNSVPRIAQVLIPPRNNSRKRPATALESKKPGERSRPPTKVTVAQPHGGLLQTTNGVQTTLGIRDDDVPSGVSTPKTNGAENNLTVPPVGAQGNQDKRTLRSQDGGSRLKSDLSIYFPNYDDVIADAPKQPEFLDLDTQICIIDEPLKVPKPQPVPAPPSSRSSASPNRSRKSNPVASPNGASNSTTPQKTPSTPFQVVDFSSINRHTNHNDNSPDPLSDSVYFAAHRRAERKEKQLRNIEKERAMHEKVQLERLLDGLQGPDWLRVMGITGVTDGEKKDWEPKRDYFVSEVRALVDKFRIWKEEEKRLKMEREAALLAREEEEAEEEDEAGAEEDDDADIPLSSDIDAWAAHQLQQEANCASSSAPKPRARRRPISLLPAPPPEPLKPFTSFYSKPHLREAALGKHRHGRNVTAFGKPIPEFEECEFALPGDYLTPDALRAHARKRRRLKRESGADKSPKR